MLKKIHLKLMKKLLFFIGFIIVVGCANAQMPYTPPLTIPPYHILTTDSVYVTPANLKKNKPVVIIYFSPDCGHCQHMMKEMKPKMKEFGDAQIVMITFMDPSMLIAVKTFYQDFGLKKYPNFIVGTEG